MSPGRATTQLMGVSLVGELIPSSDLTIVLMCFPVPNRCKNVCSHLCLLRPGGYSCACPQGSTFIEGSTTDCNAGRGAVCTAMGAWECSSAFFSSFPTCASLPAGAWKKSLCGWVLCRIERGWLEGGMRDGEI